MSQDLQIAFPCPHLAVEERVPLSADRRELELPRPLASTALVRILANQKYVIPSTGLKSQAKVKGGAPGPYQIVSGQNELEIQTTDIGVTATLPTGTRVPSGEIIAAINESLGGSTALTVSRDDGRILFSENDNYGQNSRILLGGSAAASIGFGEQRGARGRDILPGWAPFSKESDALLDTPTFRGLRFNKPLKGNWFFQVTYSMPPNLCSRCAGTRVENDWRLDEAGLLFLVKNENLLVQATQKILLTTVRSNPFHTWYGTRLAQIPGSKNTANVVGLIQDDARRALEAYQSLQRKQARYQRITPEERLESVDSVQAFPVQGNPTAFTLEVVVRNGSFRPVNVSIVFTVPGVVALAGSNGLSLGTDAVGISPVKSGLDLRPR